MRAKVSIKVGKETWLGDILAYTGGYLRVSLHSNGSDEWPQWDAATPAKCLIHEGERRYASDATILKQNRELVWVQVPPTWSGPDRRHDRRQLGGFHVRFEGEGQSGVARCLDISSGGIRLRAPVHLPEKARLKLEFRLPSDRKPVQTEGIILRAYPDSDAVYLGVKFADTPVVDSVRIATYCYH
jgi:hypothetical protein